MAVGYKNLILIDNSKSVGEANFLLCKETAKYICANFDKEDSCRIAVFGEDVEYLTDYSSDLNLLNNTIDQIDLYDRDTYITDNLVNILNEWKQQDVACRNIILFSDGEEKESMLHANEELYYMLSESGFPVYIVQSIENRSVSASKNLSAIATISKGRLILTEFDGSEGGSEIIMGDQILDAINDCRQSAELFGENKEVSEAESDPEKEQFYEEDKEEAKESEINDAVYIASDQEGSALIPEVQKAEQMHETEEAYSSASAGSEPIIKKASSDIGGIGFGVIFPALGLLFAVVFAVVIYIITKRNSYLTRSEKRLFKGVDDQIELEARIAEAAEDYDSLTYKFDEECEGTRLLEQTDNGYDITLEDCTDPTRLFRASCENSIVVGRSGGLCDIVIDRDDSISGRHCELSVRNGCWYVRDLKSSNGTRVNNQKVFQELMLKTGDILQMGQSALQVRI